MFLKLRKPNLDDLSEARLLIRTFTDFLEADCSIYKSCIVIMFFVTDYYNDVLIVNKGAVTKLFQV